MSSLHINDLEVETKALHVPPLQEVQQVLQDALPKYFHEVKVEIIECPDLKSDPYNLADSGLCGTPTLVEVGGPPYLLPVVDKTKVYNMIDIASTVMNQNTDNSFIIGAGAGPFMVHNQNCEGIYNIKIGNSKTIENGSFLARVVENAEKCSLERIPSDEKRFALLANLFCCEGKQGKVLKVYCKKRIDRLNFIECIRLTLQNHFKEKCVGLGGIFLLKNGIAKQHVMRDFAGPIINEEELNEWLKFYEMPATLNAVGTLVTNEYDLDLRLQHFHSFSKTNWGGHYHYDVTPDVVEYEGYFSIGEKIVRIDKPKNTHKFGRD